MTEADRAGDPDLHLRKWRASGDEVIIQHTRTLRPLQDEEARVSAAVAAYVHALARPTPTPGGVTRTELIELVDPGVSNWPNGSAHHNAVEAANRIFTRLQSARSSDEARLREIGSDLREAFIVARQWSGSAFLSGEMSAASQSKYRRILYSWLCSHGNSLSYWADELAALRAPTDPSKQDGEAG